MQVNLPDDAAPPIRQKAAAGFPDQIDAYVAHLIASDEIEDYGAPHGLSLAGKSREEVEAIVDAGFESGPATPMTVADWRKLHERIGRHRQQRIVGTTAGSSSSRARREGRCTRRSRIRDRLH